MYGYPFSASMCQAALSASRCLSLEIYVHILHIVIACVLHNFFIFPANFVLETSSGIMPIICDIFAASPILRNFASCSCSNCWYTFTLLNNSSTFFARATVPNFRIDEASDRPSVAAYMRAIATRGSASIARFVVGQRVGEHANLKKPEAYGAQQTHTHTNCLRTG